MNDNATQFVKVNVVETSTSAFRYPTTKAFLDDLCEAAVYLGDLPPRTSQNAESSKAKWSTRTPKVNTAISHNTLSSIHKKPSYTKKVARITEAARERLRRYDADIAVVKGGAKEHGVFCAGCGKFIRTDNRYMYSHNLWNRHWPECIKAKLVRYRLLKPKTLNDLEALDNSPVSPELIKRLEELEAQDTEKRTA